MSIRAVLEDLGSREFSQTLPENDAKIMADVQIPTFNSRQLQLEVPKAEQPFG